MGTQNRKLIVGNNLRNSQDEVMLPLDEGCIYLHHIPRLDGSMEVVTGKFMQNMFN